MTQLFAALHRCDPHELAGEALGLAFLGTAILTVLFLPGHV